MKHVLFFLLLTAFFCFPASAQECSKNSDACVNSSAPRSPFLEASSPESAKAPAKKPAAKKISAAPAAAAPVVPATAAPAAVPAAAQAAAPAPLSNPLWLFFVFGGLAVLYLYLANCKKGKRK